MARNNRAKKKPQQLLTVEEARKIADKACYKMAKEVMEMFVITTASWLTSPPYRWNKDKFLRFKKHIDRSFIGLLNGMFDKEMYYDNLREKGMLEEILKVDSKDVEKYLRGE